MARPVNRLVPLTVRNLKKAGRHADGAGLYLHIDEGGSKRWVFVFQWHGARKEMGLGSISVVTLAEAREERDKARRQVHRGINPIDERRKARARSQNATFGSLAESLLDDIEGGWRNEKHRQQWRNTLRTYASTIWATPLDAITADDVVKCLKPIWETKPGTAPRVRARIERVLDAARARGLRDGENPARWKGHLDALLTSPKKLSRGHHKAMAFAETPAFFQRLRGHEGGAARALEFTILTAARTGEVTGATWGEIDTEKALWTVPAGRMKANRLHRVPLTTEALKVLGERQNDDAYIFPGTKRGSHQSNMAMAMQLRRMKVNCTVHGFRSAFRDWAGETTDHPREVMEAALAHAVGDATERAYRRGDALEKRRRLMEDWSAYLLKPKPDQGNAEVPPPE